MRLLFKLVWKFAFLAIVVIVFSGAVRYGMQRFTKPAPTAEGAPQVSVEESDLMSTVFQSALRLVSGSATREELANELNKKLYAGRSEVMTELGIDLVNQAGKPVDVSGNPSATPAAPGAAVPTATTTAATATPKPAAPAAAPAAAPVDQGRLAQLWDRMKVCSVELTVAPVVLTGMVVWGRIRRRRENCDFLPAAIPITSDSEPYDMKHAVSSLGAEEFELLVALLYQRQGYRVSMPAALSGGRGGDFTLLRKAERVLVQCKRLNGDHNVTVERIRELHEAMMIAGATRGLYVASCRYTWDARNFAKNNAITLINARTLDEIISAGRANPQEDLLKVAEWLPGFLPKVQFTAPTCPACESAMEEVNTSHNPVWVCKQRPDCRGRRCGRKHRKALTVATATQESAVA